jgi:hypothetical protein
VYGLFSQTASFINNNFNQDSIGSAIPNRTDVHGSGSFISIAAPGGSTNRAPTGNQTAGLVSQPGMGPETSRLTWAGLPAGSDSFLAARADGLGWKNTMTAPGDWAVPAASRLEAEWLEVASPVAAGNASREAMDDLFAMLAGHGGDDFLQGGNFHGSEWNWLSSGRF